MNNELKLIGVKTVDSKPVARTCLGWLTPSACGRWDTKQPGKTF